MRSDCLEPTRTRAFSAKLEAALRAVGVLCVETVERAERYDADHELVVAMQRRLLGDLPSLSGIETAARYLPATASLAVGGDWYEGLVLGKSGWRLSSATSPVMGSPPRPTWRSFAGWSVHSSTPGWRRRTCSPNCPLSSANAAVSSSPPPPWLSSTSSTRRVAFATAGHPPPLLRLSDGEVRRLDSANSPLIGGPRGRRVIAPFPTGSKLVMYTDGLVERRDRPVDDGIDVAMSRLHTIADDATGVDIIETLLDELIGDHVAEDDIALLVMDHTGRAPGDAST